MDVTELLRLNTYEHGAELELHEKVHREFFARREESADHNPYSQEVIEQGSIRSGDLEGLYKSFQIACMRKIGTLAREPLRQAKNLAIVNIALACRSAIHGGVLPEISYTMADAFTQRVEETRTEAEAYALMRAAKVEFCKAVRDLAQSGAHSVAVRRCKELISQRLHSKLTVKELASELGLTPDYLSHLFLKEEKMKLHFLLYSEAINSEKLIAFMEAIIKTANGRKNYLILDNLRAHHSKLVAEWVEVHKDWILFFTYRPILPNTTPMNTSIMT